MNLVEFFNSGAAALPRTRNGNDFLRFLRQMMQDYITVVVSLDPKCPIGSRILGEAPNINQLAEDVVIAVEAHLNGKPDEARKRIRAALNFVSGRLSGMLSLNVPPGQMQRLFRVSELKPGDTLSRERLFHVPFHMLAIANSRRYSLPGYACLYFGGSLRVCMRECDADAAKLPSMAIAEFAPRKPVKFLDFGYRPSVIATLARARLLSPSTANPDADDLLVNYAVCWPLIAASSVLREPGNPPPEYIVPQLILEWLVAGNQCKGIRYFSTRVPADNTEIRSCSNFAFPARNLTNSTHGHCQELKDLFTLTMPILWQSVTNGVDVHVEFTANEQTLGAMPKMQIP
ncbi:MAG: hypothetical protein WAO02_11100 [Verrucomicrobiia bacterium]